MNKPKETKSSPFSTTDISLIQERNRAKVRISPNPMKNNTSLSKTTQNPKKTNKAKAYVFGS